MEMGQYIPIMLNGLIIWIFNLYTTTDGKISKFFEVYKGEHDWSWRELLEQLPVMLSSTTTGSVVTIPEITTSRLRNLIRQSPIDISKIFHWAQELSNDFYSTIFALIIVVISWAFGAFILSLLNIAQLANLKVVFIVVIPIIMFLFEIFIACQILRIGKNVDGLIEKYKNKEY